MKIDVEVENQGLWNQFSNCERNEMIITRNGRCLFPLLRFSIQLEEAHEKEEECVSPNDLFSFGLAMERVDKFKWKYRENNWHPTITHTNDPHNADQYEDTHIYEPDTSPCPWSTLQREGLNFSKVKLTNQRDSVRIESDRAPHGKLLLRLPRPSGLGQKDHSKDLPTGRLPSNYFFLSSFGNHVPIIHVLNWRAFHKTHPTEYPQMLPTLNGLFEQIPKEQLIVEQSLLKITLDQCSFIAVTHYQSPTITHLKKHNNPHAKGFILSDDQISLPRPRGRPGRKRRAEIVSGQTASKEITEDILLASLALEKMANEANESSLSGELSPIGMHNIHGLGCTKVISVPRYKQGAGLADCELEADSHPQSGQEKRIFIKFLQ